MTRDKLFPKKYILTPPYWRPMQPNENNLRKLIKESTVFLKYDANKRVSSVSFAVGYQNTKKEFCLSVFVYGHHTDGLAHIIAQIQKGTSSLPAHNKAWIMAGIPKDSDEEEVKYRLKTIGFRHMQTNHFTTMKTMLVEEPFPQFSHAKL